jgi:hypothetical protein
MVCRWNRLTYPAAGPKVTRMFVARLLASALGLTFAWAALAKLARPRAWLEALAGYRPPERLRVPIAIAVPAVEGVIAGLYFSGGTRLAAALTLFLTALFSLAILRARRLQGTRLPCGCFGSNKERDYRALLARNTVLAVAAAALLLFGRDVKGYPAMPSGDAWVAAALVALGAALIVWLVFGVRSGLRRGIT